MSQMIMTIIVAYSNSGITSGKKIIRNLKMAAILKMSKYKTQLQFDISNEKIIPNYAKKNIFIVMTSSMTSQSDLKVVSLYSFMNDKMTFFMITEERTKISSSNLVHICIIELWICVYKRSWNASLMTSSGPKISLNFELQ